MRFPFKQTVTVAKYISQNKKLGTSHFPLVLMLEPLHACNLYCEGCGRIREYAGTVKEQVSLERCIKAIDDCKAPVISICGGEPLLYKEIKPLVQASLARKRVTYLCTNGIILDKKLDLFEPNKLFNINVHIDGLEKTHDAIVKKNGAFRQATENIKLAKQKGFTICTNTTVYKETSVKEIEDLFKYLHFIGVDGMLISPGFDYMDVEDKSFFLSVDEIKEKFSKIKQFAKKYKVWSTPLFLDFLSGDRALNCTPWGNVTYNIAGWKAPCYLITDKHYEDYESFIKDVDWKRYEQKEDKRCKNCMVHSGFEATIALETTNNLKDIVRMSWWTLF